MSIKDIYTVESIKSSETYDWLLHKHYAKRIPSISYAFVLYKDRHFLGVCTFGMPPSPSVPVGVCGKKFKKIVFELNRLCVNENLEKNVLSYFVSSALKFFKKPKILVSYADTSQNHHGYIYQATNWLYTGLTVKAIEWKEKGKNTHCRGLFHKNTTQEMWDNPDKFERVRRPQKHRYIYFIGNKTQKKNMLKNLKYEIKPYPKGENKRYDASYNPTVQIKLF